MKHIKTHKAQNIMETPRSAVSDLIKEKTQLDDDIVKSIEVGIYNWTITKCDEIKVVKNWQNPRFVNIYAEKARSVINNLDANSYIGNTRLINRIKEQEFLPHELPSMKPENVFPERWRVAVENYINKTEHSYENKPMAMTDLFKCHRCKSRECTYREIQLRGSDEPMSIFVRCIQCGFSFRIG